MNDRITALDCPRRCLDDVKSMARPVLSHRLLLTPEAAIQGHTASAIIDNILAAVPVPQDPVRV